MRNANRSHALCPYAALAVALVAGCSGSNGAPGQSGTSGTSCSVSATDGGAVIHCTDGTSVTVPSGTNGMNGASADGGACTVFKNADGGTYTLDCGGDAGAITVLPAIADYATMTADEIADAQMTATITNVGFPADGRPVISIKVTERHGYGVKDLSTTAVTWRFSLLKLVPGIAGTTGGVNGSASDTWVSYLAPNDHTAASAETAVAANLDRPRRRDLRLQARPGHQRRPHHRRHDLRPRRYTSAHRLALRFRQSVRAHQPGQGIRPLDREPMSPDRTTRSTARPASSATPRSAPSRAARASSDRASSMAEFATTSGLASLATTINAVSTARATRWPSRLSPPTGPGRVQRPCSTTRR